MKRSPMKRKPSNINKRSSKRYYREREAAPVRLALVARTERCECCGRRKPANELAVHEIIGGAFRVRALDKLFATLVICQIGCHAKVQNENKPRQLARLFLNRPSDFDLPAFLKLWCRAPNAIELDEVLREVDLILESKV